MLYLLYRGRIADLASQGMYPALMLVVVAAQKTRFEDHLTAGERRAPIERNSLSMHFASNHQASTDILSTPTPDRPVFFMKETFEDTPYAHVTV